MHTDFPLWFGSLWHHAPFPCQALLAERVASGHWPRALDLPTASGKTACLDIAVYALAAQADRPLAERTAPRRIWFVVDRRIVVDEAFERARTIAQKLADATSGPLREIADRLRELSGTATLEREVRPLERDFEEKRRRWLGALRDAAPRPELALGKRIEDAGPEDYRALVAALFASNDSASREGLDLLAACGSDACPRKDGSLQSTPFQFTPGSGHQYFLHDVGHLTGEVSPERVWEALFRRWTYGDEGLSLRWDPVEDRRYALSDRDPSSERTRTVWMANLLRYRALVLFPAAPAGRHLAVSGWIQGGDRSSFTWPLWAAPLSWDAVRSLVQSAELARPQPDLVELRARGVVAVYRSDRITVGSGTNKKFNFAPARQL